MTDEASSGRETYPVHGKPWGVAPGERKWLSVRPDEDLHEVRRGLDYQIVLDSERGEATVEITFHHQRRGKTPGTSDEEPFLLYKLKAGEAIRLAMNSDETLALYRHPESPKRFLSGSRSQPGKLTDGTQPTGRGPKPSRRNRG